MIGPIRRSTARVLDLIDAAATRRADRTARAMGLTVERIPGTRIHVYSRGYPRWSEPFPGAHAGRSDGGVPR